MELLAWLEALGRQVIVIEYLMAENRMLRERLKRRSLRFTDRERALPARRAFGIPRRVLLDLGTTVTLETLLRWRRATDRSQVRLAARTPALDANQQSS
jgi:hypothetical protein